ncbi:MAG: acyltransferase [Alphaproteobacteria bacterium]|nr:acyltransferase [Alphaproteobacteria bacterium]
MHIFYKKQNYNNAHIYVYFCGIRIYSYKPEHLTIINGENNSVTTPKNSKVLVRVHGNNNNVVVEESIHDEYLTIEIGTKEVQVNNCDIHIGKNSSMGLVRFLCLEDNTKIWIGDDCMFSINIVFYPSDMHAIIDSSGNVSNIGHYINIGNHVWIGESATILKNSYIPDNSIIGTKSVVKGDFSKYKGIILAGNPARVVKTDINWDRKSPKKYLEQQVK